MQWGSLDLSHNSLLKQRIKNSFQKIHKEKHIYVCYWLAFPSHRRCEEPSLLPGSAFAWGPATSIFRRLCALESHLCGVFVHYHSPFSRLGLFCLQALPPNHTQASPWLLLGFLEPCISAKKKKKKNFTRTSVVIDCSYYLKNFLLWKISSISNSRAYIINRHIPSPNFNHYELRASLIFSIPPHLSFTLKNWNKSQIYHCIQRHLDIYIYVYIYKLWTF